MSGTMDLILIGLDDTDNDTSPGTGNMARRLSAECARRGMTPVSITRHQLLLDDRIPYTSHNSSACVAVDGPEVSAAAFAFEFVASRSADGSDPGVCVCRQSLVPQPVRDFAGRATREVLDMAEAIELAAASGLALRGLGGTELGVIGALSAVGLRAGGSDGRVIDMPGLRDLPDRVSAGELLGMGIGLDHQGDRAARDDDAYATLGWVRPRMVAGRAVLPVQWSDEHDAWTPVDTKRSRPLE